MVLVISVLAACSSGKGRCHKVREYQSATNAPRIQSPDGMEQLDDRLRLEIPEGEVNTTKVPKGEKCLDYPHRYFKEVELASPKSEEE
ncbi:MAG: hypothetical protein P8R04_02400, partial [Gammaproteobacteria bacterium]|nr:hypothetical protein [Gammaproteobacteria bacterium]